jgi:glycosyltransferase involved in cell wall biosynthesis
VVAGLHTETLLPAGETLPDVEVRGWLEDDALHALLARVTAVVVPPHRGFGALTRMPELACAGVPLIVSRSATFAQDAPPGAVVVEDRWDAWCAAMESMCDAGGVVPADAYEAWEAGQPRPLAGVLKSLHTGR